MINKKEFSKLSKSLIAAVSALAILGGSLVASNSMIEKQANENVASAGVATGTGSGGGSGPSGEANSGGWRNFGVNGIHALDLSSYSQWPTYYEFLMAAGGQNLVDTCTNFNTNTYVHVGENGGGMYPYPVGNIPSYNNVSAVDEAYRGYIGPRVFVICVNNPDQLVSQYEEYRVTSTKPVTPPINENGSYSLTTTVAPEITRAGKDVLGRPLGLDPIGANNLNSQTTPALKTNLGKVYDAIQADPEIKNFSKETESNLAKKYKAKIEKAVTADKAANRPGANLNKNNQKGMAEGGVLNVTEFGVPVQLRINTKETKYQLQKRTVAVWSLSGNKYGAWAKASSKGEGPWFRGDEGVHAKRWNERVNEKNGVWSVYSNKVVQRLATQKSLGFWQMLSVNCNLAGIDALIASDPELKVINKTPTSGGTQGLYNVTLVTPKVDKRPKAVLGNVKGHKASTTAGAAKRATGNIGFYDKECAFVCTPSSATTSGASVHNGAVDNVGNAGRDANSKGLYGNKVTKDAMNGNYLELFRDFNANTIRPDVWYPVSGNGLTYAGEAPKSTILSRLGSGTPNNIETSGASTLQEVFRMTYTNSEGKVVDLFTSGAKGSYKAKNSQAISDVSPYSSLTLGRAPGLVTELNAHGAWTSSNGKPQVINTKWEYNPTITKTVPLTNIGMNPLNSTGPKYTVGVVSTKVDGICIGEFGTTSSSNFKKNIKDANSNTGTGSTTKWPVTVTGDPINGSQNIVLKFIRAAGE